MNKLSLSDYDIYEMMLKQCICGSVATLASAVAASINKDNMVMVFCMNEKCKHSTDLFPSLKEVVEVWNSSN